MRAAENVMLAGPLSSQMLPISEVQVEWNPDDGKLAQLESLYGRRGSLAIPRSGSAEDETETYRKTLSLLREAFALSYSPWQQLGVKTIISDWLEKIPRGFLDLLGERRPKALILLAHLACLLKRAEHFWYMKGAGERIVSTILISVGEEWLDWIQWPLEVMGMN